MDSKQLLDDLPSFDEIKRIAVIGLLAKQLNIDGENALTILEKSLNPEQELRYAEGHLTTEEVNETVMNEAQRAAAWADLVIIFVGFSEKEARENSIKLPTPQNVLVEVICQVEKNVVVVVCADFKVKMPWAKRVKKCFFFT